MKVREEQILSMILGLDSRARGSAIPDLLDLFADGGKPGKRRFGGLFTGDPGLVERAEEEARVR
jgi:hypothetical protein